MRALLRRDSGDFPSPAMISQTVTAIATNAPMTTRYIRAEYMPQSKRPRQNS